MPGEPKGSNIGRPIFERRRFIRINGNFVVSYSDISTAQPKTDVSQTRNISLGGILFTTDRRFEIGTVLRLKIRLPESIDYINVKAKVVGSREKAKDILYETRVKFIAIKDEDRDAINKLVEYHTRNR